MEMFRNLIVKNVWEPWSPIVYINDCVFLLIIILYVLGMNKILTKKEKRKKSPSQASMEVTLDKVFS